MIKRLWCWPWQHEWISRHVTAPLWDASAYGLLKTCTKCGKVVAK